MATSGNEGLPKSFDQVRLDKLEVKVVELLERVNALDNGAALDITRCPVCQGKGQIARQVDHHDSCGLPPTQHIRWIDCWKCGGKGWLEKENKR